ncbi:MAG TPA: hypothetical protein VHE60_16755 [Pyrinomonadaceae bacterium]|nr:hypothetical protein [Pyrinomonadaceae bacterium]
MIICPSCGSNFEGDLCLGCPSCGARAVGPPLARAEHELRSYGRALGAAASGAVMFAGFVGSVIVTLVQYKPSSLRFWAVLFRSWTIISASEVAAWRLKWLVVPAAIVALWSGRLSIRSIKNSSSRFGGLRLARAGFVVSAAVTVLIATLIGITIPERLRQRQDAIYAAIHARGYALHRALLEYRELHGTLPTPDDFSRELRTLPDPDGSIADALRYVDASGYQATSVLASASTKGKPLALRGGALRNAPAASTNADPPGVSFTIYELRLPSEHKLLSTDDDFIMRDGLITKASDPPPPSSAPTHSTRP